MFLRVFFTNWLLRCKEDYFSYPISCLYSLCLMRFHCVQVTHFKFNIQNVIHNNSVAKGATSSKRLDSGLVQVNPLSWGLTVKSWVNPWTILSFSFQIITNSWQIFFFNICILILNFSGSKSNCKYHKTYINHIGHPMECSLRPRTDTVNHSTWTKRI